MQGVALDLSQWISLRWPNLHPTADIIGEVATVGVEDREHGMVVVAEVATEGVVVDADATNSVLYYCLFQSPHSH